MYTHRINRITHKFPDSAEDEVQHRGDNNIAHQTYTHTHSIHRKQSHARTQIVAARSFYAHIRLNVYIIIWAEVAGGDVCTDTWNALPMRWIYILYVRNAQCKAPWLKMYEHDMFDEQKK